MTTAARSGKTSTVTLADGRAVAVQSYGDPDGAPVLWLHGAGSSRLEAQLLDRAAAERGLAVHGLDRPGCGGSDPLPGLTVPGYADDVLQVADQMGIDAFTVAGLSNGGMYAMAVGGAAPDRLERVVAVNPTSPSWDPACAAVLSRRTRMTYDLVRKRPGVVEKQAAKDVKVPGRLTRVLARRLNPDIDLIAQPGVAESYTATRAEVQRQPDSGYLRQDMALAVSDWGFDHLAVQVPVVVVSGEHDGGLPYARVWVEALPDARLQVVPGGHLGLLADGVQDTVADALAGR